MGIIVIISVLCSTDSSWSKHEIKDYLNSWFWRILDNTDHKTEKETLLFFPITDF